MSYIYELQDSGELTKDGYRLHYHVRDAADSSAALTVLIAEAPSDFDGWPLVGTRVVPIYDGLYDCEVTYNSQPDNATTEIGTTTESFDITAQTVKITHSIDHVKYPSSGDSEAPEVNGAINVKFDGKAAEVEGCDIYVPTYAFSITKVVAVSAVDSAFKFAMAGLVGKVCSDSFGPFAAGECLFFGLRGTQRDSAAYELTYSFLASPNVTGLSFGDVSGVDKKGWDYLSITYYTSLDGANFALVPKVQGVYVHQVYQTTSFSSLPAPS